MALRFSEGHYADPKDWTEKVLLEIIYAEEYGDKRWLSVGVWVSKGDRWFFTCTISCDDISPSMWGGVCLTLGSRIVSVFPRDETMLSISSPRLAKVDLDVVSSITVFREGVE